MKDLINRIIQGDALKILKTFPGESIDMVMTSPPYWALRDYGMAGQLGLEPTFQEYINKLCDIFDEVKRVLKKEGTCWVVIGDTYGGSGKGAGGKSKKQLSNKGSYFKKSKESWNFSKVPITEQDVSKSLCQIPSRFAIEMANRGWILRNEIIWHKPNCMPSSVKDRFTVDFEKIFFFVKNKKYYFETQYDEATSTDNFTRDRDNTRLNNTPGRTKMGGLKTNHYIKRNKRCVWEITTKGYSEAHFAVYPEKLCEIPIKAGCPPKGIVLDPFFGSGTTGLVAQNLGRNWIGIELNKDYIKIANKRLAQKPML